MNKVKVYNLDGQVAKEIELNSKIFDIDLNVGLVQQVVQAQMANARQVLAHTKTKGEVRGGGKKPWKQKGTGRARHGSIRSPLWVGGGVTFGPRKDRNFTKQINKKMKRKALFMCLTDKVRSDSAILVDKFELEAIKTKGLIDTLNKLPVLEERIKKTKIKKKDQETKIEEKKVKEIAKTLIVSPKTEKNTLLSSRNLKNIDMIDANSLNVVDVLKYKYLIILEDSLKVIEKTYLQS